MTRSPRRLGLVSATALVVASMIGTGVFTTSGFLLGDLHSPWTVLAAWAGGGVLATLGALSYGALARRIPESGGEYLFLSRTLHPAAGYIAGWVSLLAGFSAPLAAVAFGFGDYLKAWLPGLDPQWTGTALVLACAGLHSLEVKQGAWVQNGAVLLKVILLLAFAGLAVGRLHVPTVWTWGPTSASTFAVSLVWVSFSYAGWNAAIYVAGEVQHPERNLPRSLLLGTAVVTLLYLALNAVFVFAAPPGALAGKLEVGRLAAQALGGAPWATGVTLLVALALLTSASSLVMCGPRVYARMAADGYLPRALAPSDGPPRLAILLQVVLALAMLWTATYDRLLTYIGFTLNLCSALTVAGLVKLRRREGAALPVPGWPWVPAIYLLAVYAITLFTIARRPSESALGLVTLALGGIVWRLQRRRAAPPA